MEFKYRRAPAIYRTISSIDNIKDIRVRLLGKVVEKMNGSIIFEDYSGKTEIIIDNYIVESLNIGETIRIFCRVMQLDNGRELRAELIQDMNNMDRELYEKIFEKA